jgi:hypothetical protein
MQMILVQYQDQTKFQTFTGTSIVEPEQQGAASFWWSRSHKEPHHFGGTGAVTRCGSGSNPNIHHWWIIKNVKNKGKVASTLVCFQKVGLLYCKVG